MNKFLLNCFILVFTIGLQAQITYEPGYYINNADEKVSCLILNMDWKNNPEQFECKISEKAQVKTLTIKNVKEFGVGTSVKYVRETVQMDWSSNSLQNLGYVRAAKLEEETVFLKALVSGEATLFSYEDGNLKRFFYKSKDGDTEALIYKKYLNQDGLIAENNRYKQQLFNTVRCDDMTMSSVEKLSYHTNDLVKYFVKYNSCGTTQFVDYTDKGKQDFINLTLRPGIRSSELTIENTVDSGLNATFDNQTSFVFGMEVEFIMGFNKGKWSVIFEPTYQSFSSDGVSEEALVSVEYSSVEFPVGLRHYMFLNDSSKLFVNASLMAFDLSFNSDITYENRDALDVETRTNLIVGFGYKYNDKYSLELQYSTNRNLLGSYVSYGTNYSSLSMKFGYTLF